MISVVYGVPGSGKSYYAVHWIKKRALIEGDIFFRVRPDVLLITNLKLNLDSSEGYIYIEDFHDFAKYMDVDFWRANFTFLQGKKVYIVMDECQLFFFHYKDDPKVLFFLQYHRHLSVDILLITQTPKSLPAKVFELSEFLIEAVPKSVNPFSFKAFRYRVLHPFDRDIVLRRFHLGFDPVVFHLYSDMIYKFEEGEKPKNAFVRYYAFVVVFVLAFLFFTSSFFSYISSLAHPKKGAYVSHRVDVPSPVVPSSGGAVPVRGEMRYEDLITEEKAGERFMSGDKVSRGIEKVPKRGDDFRVPEGSYHLTVEGSVRSSGDVIPSGVKVVELP